MGSFRLADRNHGSLFTFAFPLVARVLSAEEQNTVWFRYKDIWQDWQFNSVFGLVKMKQHKAEYHYKVESVVCAAY